MRKAFSDRFQALLGATDVLCVIAILILMLHVTADVAVKYLGFHPLAGTTEIVSHWYMPIIAFLPLAAVEYRREHIRADLIDQFAPAWVVRAGDIVAHLVSLAFFLLFSYAGWHAAEGKRAIGAFVMGTENVLIWPTYYMVPIGCGLMCVAVLLNLVEDATRPIAVDRIEGATP